MKEQAGFKVLTGNLFDSAIMKTSVISEEFRDRYLSTRRTRTRSRAARSCSTDRRTITTASTIRRSKIDEHTMLFMRGAGPIGYPGAAEVVNMQPPAALIKKGITSLPCIGDGRQSGTSGSPSILNASPEAAAGGGLALLEDRRPRAHRPQQGHGEHPDFEGRARRAPRRAAEARRLSHIPTSQTPWQEIQRSMVDQLDDGMVLKPAVKYQRVAQTGACRGTITDEVSVPHAVQRAAVRRRCGIAQMRSF